MSNTDEIDESLPNEDKFENVIAHSVRDDALCHLVSVANGGAGFGITIVVDGQVIYGDLISGKQYCEKMYESFKNIKGGEVIAEAVGSYFKNLGEDLYTNESFFDIPVNYLHLDNYAFVRGDGSLLNISGSVLRVSVQRVSAFALGRRS